MITAAFLHLAVKVTLDGESSASASLSTPIVSPVKRGAKAAKPTKTRSASEEERFLNMFIDVSVVAAEPPSRRGGGKDRFTKRGNLGKYSGTPSENVDDEGQ